MEVDLLAFELIGFTQSPQDRRRSTHRPAGSAVAPAANSRPAAHKQTRPCLTCVRVLRPVGAQIGQRAGFASRRMWAEQSGRARRRELDPQHVSAPGAPHRLDMRGQIGVPLRTQESNHCPHVGGRAGASRGAGRCQVRGAEQDARAGARGEVAERRDGNRLPRRQPCDDYQQPRIGLTVS
jgi:hypothetical protein